MYTAAMIERKAALFRLYPTPQQASQMAQIAGACRFVYNLALEQRRDCIVRNTAASGPTKQEPSGGAV